MLFIVLEKKYKGTLTNGSFDALTHQIDLCVQLLL